MNTRELVIENRQSQPFDVDSLTERLNRITSAEGVGDMRLVITLVDDSEIHRVNREFLDHDWPTDVISFSYAEADAGDKNREIDGELVVSVETAVRQAEAHGWRIDDELLLYCVHGFLHLCGYDDLNDEDRPRMRRRERELLATFGLVPHGLQS